MIISSSAISMSSEHAYAETHQSTISLKAWVGDRRPDFEGRGAAAQLAQSRSQVSISNAAKNSLKQASDAASKPKKPAATGDDSELDPRIALIKAIIEAFTGKKIHIMSASDATEQDSAPQDTSQSGQQAQAAPQQQGWGVEYDSQTVDAESEQTSFSAQGVVKTADGKEIDFTVSLNMSRDQVSTSDVSIRAGDAVKKTDPLVINYSGSAAELTDTKFTFDLNSDGTGEQVSFVAPGSGFLALDKNGNGTIDNGSELFGPSSGNGFSDLKALDTDGNGWIDENDKAYSDLQVWSKDSAGADILKSLRDTGVGAIYLGSIDTPFTYKDDSGNSAGEAVSAGVFLNDNGTAGTVQQVNLFA